MQGDLDTIHELSAGLDPKTMEPGGHISVSLVELNNPVVDGSYLVQPVDVAWGRWPSVREPSQLWGVEKGGYHQLVLNAWVVVVLVIDGVLELQDGVGEGGHGATFNQVVYPSNQQDSHGLG